MGRPLLDRRTPAALAAAVALAVVGVATVPAPTTAVPPPAAGTLSRSGEHPQRGVYSGHDARHRTVHFLAWSDHVLHFTVDRDGAHPHRLGDVVIRDGTFHHCDSDGCLEGAWVTDRLVVGVWRGRHDDLWHAFRAHHVPDHARPAPRSHRSGTNR